MIEDDYKSTEKYKNLIDYGYLAYIFERIFRFLQKCLPPQAFLENRVDHQNRINKIIYDDDWKYEIKKRSKILDKYIGICILIESILAFVAINFNICCYIKFAIIFLIILRLIDIIQVNINIVLFDNFRIITFNGKRDNYISSIVRSIILILINYCEIIICFSIFYILYHNYFVHDIKWYNAFYFSFITQLTIGYGDIVPMNINKIVVIIQGMIGFIFAILIISRFINFLPKISSIDNENN